MSLKTEKTQFTMVVNIKTIQELINVIGLDDTKELLDIYFSTAPESVKNIQLGVQKSDPEKVRFWGHRLKGASGTLGFELLKEASMSIEVFGGLGDIQSAKPIAEKLETLVADTKDKVSKSFPTLI